ncbi:MAG: cytochrome C [Gammaproteobacteria bacterium]|nr:cytochrome C [Gammaproteobacteria bacterium]
MFFLITCTTATAQSIESLIMPGEVIEGHAKVESECSACHKRFNRDEQNVLCLDCHESIASDVSNKAGFHGKHPRIPKARCARCHTDHEGRNADIVNLNESSFDHDLTDFELHGKHVDAECEDCHAPQDKHRDAPQDCHSCHEKDDVHKGSLGLECAVCHNESDWADALFDHDETDFPLLGNHEEVACGDCHADQTYQDTPRTCFGCHAGDDAHDGRSGSQCENCHNPLDWNDTSFNHARDTRFPLEGKHSYLTCNDCHSENPFDDIIEPECKSCHLDDDFHDGHHGTDCAACHDSEAWNGPTFHHATDTGFALNGAHAQIACVDCHIEPVFEKSPETYCAACHVDDDVHEGSQGENCNSCHSENQWLDPPLFNHDLTAFPLLGAHVGTECGDCHASQRFVDALNECVACHEEDNTHGDRFEDRCDTCHNPVAWDLWLFDHNVQTDFTLRGAHVDVACHDCHRKPLSRMKNNGDSCAKCHRADDIHDGEFGPDCGRCHSDRTFKEVRSLQ